MIYNDHVIETFHTIDEARQLLKISRVTLYRWINTGRIPATKIGGTYRIRKQDIDAFLNGTLTFTGTVDNTDTAPIRNPLSITASDIEKWASKNRTAQEVLPELIRRLLQAIQREIGLIDLHIPSGDSIGQSGWDGRTESKRDCIYVPAGVSAWEMGTGPAKRKAESDYKKRTDNPLNVQPSKTTFIFVTTEEWAEKDDWVNAKQKDAIWKRVRVIDANDLEAWLEMLPPVKAWFLGILGRGAEGVKDLETWWEDWSHETRPPISIGLTIAGRQEPAEQLQQELLDNATTKLTVIAESRMEALAFIIASVLSLRSQEPHS
jgi:excisionase family DNA binding protein